MIKDPEGRRDYQRKYAQEKRRGAGKCASCPEPALPGKSRCQKHLDEFNAYLRARRQARADADLCSLCPDTDVRPAVAGKTLCQVHLDKQKARAARRRAAD